MKELILFILSTMIILSKSLFIPNDAPPLKLTEFISPLTYDLDTAETNFRNSYSGWRYGNSDGYGRYIPGSYTQYGIPISQSNLNLPSRQNWDGYGTWPGLYSDTAGYIRPGWQGK